MGSETVSYIVVSPIIIQNTIGIVRGCKARVSFWGRRVDCVVADKGPRNKIGELSIAAACAIGLPENPRHGGTDEPVIAYKLWPGIVAPGFVLQPA